MQLTSGSNQGILPKKRVQKQKSVKQKQFVSFCSFVVLPNRRLLKMVLINFNYLKVIKNYTKLDRYTKFVQSANHNSEVQVYVLAIGYSSGSSDILFVLF